MGRWPSRRSIRFAGCIPQDIIYWRLSVETLLPPAADGRQLAISLRRIATASVASVTSIRIGICQVSMLVYCCRYSQQYAQVWHAAAQDRFRG